MPRGHSFPLQYHCAQYRGNAKHMTQNLEAQRVPGESGIGRMKSSSHTSKEAPAVVVQGIRADMGSAVAVQVNNSLGRWRPQLQRGRSSIAVLIQWCRRGRRTRDVLCNMCFWKRCLKRASIPGYLSGFMIASSDKPAPTRGKIKQDRKTPTADRAHF